MVYHRLSEQQESTQKEEEQAAKTGKIRRKALDYLIKQNSEAHPELATVFQGLRQLQEKEMITQLEILGFAQTLFSKSISKQVDENCKSAEPKQVNK